MHYYLGLYLAALSLFVLIVSLTIYNMRTESKTSETSFETVGGESKTYQIERQEEGDATCFVLVWRATRSLSCIPKTSSSRPLRRKH